MQRPADCDARVFGTEFLTELEPLLQIRLAGCKLAADREKAAPSTPAARHSDFVLAGFCRRKEAAAGILQSSDRLIGDAVTAA